MLHFLGIGAQKSGTSWIFENLKRHPGIYFPQGIKEMHFWDLHAEKGLPWYLSQFPDDNGKINGEITPAYAILNEAEIRLIAGISPELKLFYIMRDPRARAWSAALMEMRRAGLSFEETADEWFIEQIFSDGSLKRGDYETCLRHWREVFSPGHLLLLKFRDIKARPHALLQEIADHIGADPAFFAPEAGNVVLERVHAGAACPLRPTIRPVLEKLYAAQVERLNHYLGAPWFAEDGAWDEQA